MKNKTFLFLLSIALFQSIYSIHFPPSNHTENNFSSEVKGAYLNTGETSPSSSWSNQSSKAISGICAAAAVSLFGINILGSSNDSASSHNYETD